MGESDEPAQMFLGALTKRWNKLNEARAVPGQYFVAMCDVLGFKALVERSQDLDRLYQTYVKMVKYSFTSSWPGSWVNTQIGGLQVFFSFGYAVFSDTLLLWSEPFDLHIAREPTRGDAVYYGMDSLDPETRQMIDWSLGRMFVMHLSGLIPLGLRLGFPLRIGVAFGECTMDRENGIYVGQPIVDAYEVEEQQNWIGGAFHPTCLRSPVIANQIRGDVIAVRHTIPQHEAGTRLPLELALNWRAFERNPEIEALLIEGENRHRHCSPRVHDKWKNALDFFQARSQ